MVIPRFLSKLRSPPCALYHSTSTIHISCPLFAPVFIDTRLRKQKQDSTQDDTNNYSDSSSCFFEEAQRDCIGATTTSSLFFLHIVCSTSQEAEQRTSYVCMFVCTQYVCMYVVRERCHISIKRREGESLVQEEISITDHLSYEAIPPQESQTLATMG